ncbi:type IV secretion system DotC family protein [Acetobacter sp. TBRC 12305]|uniref:Type IV secretion system DotC family protein n=1 Tax=Acetobacter garciniae TaxID=2817435 RepID=A0A939HQ68_9PROT|nr:type IV secretion system DotC family protein [Acetobacter garciniae]MBO1326264.1 type IV secretion system DotC family protein [Acetobacter garciniae]MBX0345998.1 type IV secretion system DotC family protein [Acetobacter garciniae]
MARKFVLSLTATLCLGVAAAHAQSAPVSLPVPADPVEEPDAASAIDNPISGAAIAPTVTDSDRPASLEALMAIRPGYSPRPDTSAGRDDAIRQNAWAYGAQGGTAAKSFAINDMLRHYEHTLDQEFNFRPLVLPVNGGQTLLRPPVVTEGQMAMALDPNGQTARETGRVWRITRQAQLVSAPPQWRTWLVRTITQPEPPADALRPRTREEVEIWREGVARGWAAGERLAVETFLDDLARLERDMIGMGRYRVLLKAGKVEAPEVVFYHRDTQGGHDVLRENDTEIRIRAQHGLDANRAHWHLGATGNE